jgi:hypothetical protein
MADVSTLLGHSSITVTERYAHRLGETLREAAAGTSFPVVPGDLSRFGDLNPRPAVYETGADPWSFAAVHLPPFPPGNDVFRAGLAAGFSAGLALAGLVAA